ncbi:hypothetical protein IP510_04720 [Psychrobacter sp. NG254]|uniref:hypothetical protein n=1 Tax=Psychrobacter sp. NG254 TaxID=2782003 RepID=UPI0018870CCD|nr:hypothetical protein [Psychrobacter sp. NG254]MBF2719183.1 hypothetical protein [Psychrobacter sp. NG254]
MSIIDQLEKIVTPAVLGARSDLDSVAYISLLEQFYAILAARLAVSQVYSQLLRTDQVVVNDNITEAPLFEQLWQDHSQQQTIIKELSATHHIDESMTTQLLINAAPLAYRELKSLANGQFLPAFLQKEQAALRPYLPIWSAAIITATQNTEQGVEHPSPQSIGEDNDQEPVTAVSLDKPDHLIVSSISSVNLDKSTAATYVEQTGNSQDSVNSNIQGNDVPKPNASDVDRLDAIHASPAAHHLAENGSLKREQVRTRNQRNDLLIRVFLLVVAVAALALAAWVLLIKPNSEIPATPVAVVPAVPPPIPEPPVQTTPIELIIGVDNTGNLYTCSGTVGDAALQSTIQQAVNTSFGEQASICELAIQQGRSTSITNMPTDIIPNVLTMLRSTPFARLQLQNDRLILDAPDSIMLQQLVENVRSLVPAMAIDSNPPLPLSNSVSNGDMTNGVAGMNGPNNQFENGANANNQYNNDGLNNANGDYQAADDDTSDRVIPAPLPNNNNGFSNTPNNMPANVPSNVPNNLPSNNRTTRPPGPFSQSEVDEMASTIIMAEPAQVRQ